ncbi:class I SAM-dependent methyltransferase [Nostoc flagelliforme FACHB-838]|uniref:Class I SAM-dependent methyltransferase n=1 Tax=Nostoc flagelliforme FACHB-838 TaxID=2692904 RepID=A0ABR8DK70_9NOSO|nr:class I SAM-dependent methyltransferase [Nostoc flagelliforme]MBD2529852.1 class I SAM-dependent methyltransferase [Nostoc flagelliforme FACHB-838]
MVALNINSKYDSWARIYNQYWGARYCENNLPPFEQLLQEYQIYKGASILDLCCGTGHMAQHLIEQGYKVTGLDISEAMLRYARENAPNAQFILDDARFFKLPPSFDAVISPSGSLNHIMTIEELQQVFTKVYNALLDNGVFLFALNLEDGYTSWNGVITDGDVKDDFAWACCDSYNSREKIGQFKITIFQLVEKVWQRFDINNLVRAYSQGEISSALECVGFKNINVYERNGNLANSECNDFAIFVGHKQSNK